VLDHLIMVFEVIWVTEAARGLTEVARAASSISTLSIALLGTSITDVLRIDFTGEFVEDFDGGAGLIIPVLFLAGEEESERETD
jgi:hypothetical protein